MLGRRSLTAGALQPGCSIMRASPSVAPMVSPLSVLSELWALPCPALVKPHTYGSLCRCAATGHRPAVSLRCAGHRFGLRPSAHRAKGRASQIFDLSRAIPPFGRNGLAAFRGQPALRLPSAPPTVAVNGLGLPLPGPSNPLALADFVSLRLVGTMLCYA